MSALLDDPMSKAAGDRLKPYVPRLMIEWLRDTPEARYTTIDGSLVFVDISGFTALTERLARRGKIGAEIMRDTLDGVFTALLDEAYDWGAGLLKWGGDALLLLFDGPLHARAGGARVLGDAEDPRPGRAASGRRRHDRAAHVDRDHDGEARVLSRRQCPPGAADRRPWRNRDGDDRGDR